MTTRRSKTRGEDETEEIGKYKEAGSDLRVSGSLRDLEDGLLMKKLDHLSFEEPQHRYHRVFKLHVKAKTGQVIT